MVSSNNYLSYQVANGLLLWELITLDSCSLGTLLPVPHSAFIGHKGGPHRLSMGPSPSWSGAALLDREAICLPTTTR